MDMVRIKQINGNVLTPTRVEDVEHCLFLDLYIPRDTPVQKGRNTISLDFHIALPSGVCAVILSKKTRTTEDVNGCQRNGFVLLDMLNEGFKGNVDVVFHSEDFFVLGRGTRIARMLICGCNQFDLVDE